MVAPEDFETRLAALEQTRVDTETAYFRLLRDLEARVAAGLEAATAAGVLAAKQQPIPTWTEIEAPRPTTPVEQRAPIAEPPAVAWSTGRSWWRRRLNAILRWLWRDQLQALDERHEGIAATSRALSGEITALRGDLERLRGELAPGAELHDAVNAIGSRQAETVPRLHGRIEAVRETVDRLREAVDLVAGLSEHQRLLADTKDAENLTRATGGPMRHSGILLDELARQQEALLSELVGKRHELEELVARARGDE